MSDEIEDEATDDTGDDCSNCGGHGGTSERPCWSCTGSGRVVRDDFYDRVDRAWDARDDR